MEETIKPTTFLPKVAESPVFQEKHTIAKIEENPVFTLDVDCEVLFITDCKLHHMHTQIMNHGTSVEKIFCPTFGDTDYVVDNSHIKKNCR